MTEIKTNGHTLIVVPCQIDAIEFGWRYGLFSYETPETQASKTETYKTISEIDEYRLDMKKSERIDVLGTITANEIDFDCEQYVKKYNNGAYRNYGDKIGLWTPDYDTDNICLDKNESLRTLLQSHNIHFENPIPKPEFKADYIGQSINENMEYHAKLLEYNEAQSKVISKAVILLKQ